MYNKTMHIIDEGDVTMAGRKNTAERPAKTKKARKQYPSHEERISAADKKIEHLNALIAERKELVAKTE